MTAPRKKNDWFVWLDWEDAAHCQWALDYLLNFGVGNPPDANEPVEQQLAHLLDTWPKWESCLGADLYAQMERQTRQAYRAFKKQP